MAVVGIIYAPRYIKGQREVTVAEELCDGCSICECDGAGPAEKWVSAMRQATLRRIWPG